MMVSGRSPAHRTRESLDRGAYSSLWSVDALPSVALVVCSSSASIASALMCPPLRTACPASRGAVISPRRVSPHRACALSVASNTRLTLSPTVNAVVSTCCGLPGEHRILLAELNACCGAQTGLSASHCAPVSAWGCTYGQPAARADLLTLAALLLRVSVMCQSLFCTSCSPTPTSPAAASATSSSSSGATASANVHRRHLSGHPARGTPSVLRRCRSAASPFVPVSFYLPSRLSLSLLFARCALALRRDVLSHAVTRCSPSERFLLFSALALYTSLAALVLQRFSTLSSSRLATSPPLFPHSSCTLNPLSALALTLAYLALLPLSILCFAADPLSLSASHPL